MEAICDFFEKTKNLIKWDEPRMTKYFCLLFFTLFLFVTFLPIRTILIIYLTYKFYRGQFYHKRRVRNNREVVTIEFMNFLDDNKLRAFFGNLEDKWENILANCKGKDMKQFEQKISQHFQETLKLYFPKEILKLCETPMALIDYVSKVKEVLKLRETDKNEMIIENNSNLYRRSVPGYIYLHNFIMNRVPTDIYRIKNPKLEIERDKSAAATNSNREVLVVK